MQIRKKIFLYSANDGDGDLRMVLFGLMCRSMVGVGGEGEGGEKGQLFEKVIASLGENTKGVGKVVREKLEEGFGKSEEQVEGVLVNLINNCPGCDTEIIQRFKNLMEADSDGAPLNLTKIINWFE